MRIKPFLFILFILLSSTSFSQDLYLLDSSKVLSVASSLHLQEQYYFYDKQNKLLNEKTSWGQIKYKYFPNGYIRELYSQDDFEPYFKEEYILDKNENAIIYTLSNFPNDTTEVLTINCKDYNEFDSQNRLKFRKRIGFTSEGNAYLLHTLVNIYNNSRHLKSIYKSYDPMGQLITTDSTINQFNSDHNIVRTDRYHGLSEWGHLHHEAINLTYEGLVLLKKEFIYYSGSTGSITNRKLEEYSYKDQKTYTHYYQVLNSGEKILKKITWVGEADPYFSLIDSTYEKLISSDSEREIWETNTITYFENSAILRNQRKIKKNNNTISDRIEKKYYHKILSSNSTLNESIEIDLTFLSNPINSGQSIEFKLNSTDFNQIQIFNSNGELVKNQMTNNEEFQILWGIQTSGTFFVRVLKNGQPRSKLHPIIII